MPTNPKPNHIKQIVFCGCGGMYHYYIGIASVLQKYLKEHKQQLEHLDIIYGGISGGCFPSVFLALDMDVDQLNQTLGKEILESVSQHRLGALFNYNHYARHHALKYLPEDACKRVNGRLKLSLTQIPSMNNQLVNHWVDNEDLVDGIVSSAYVPLFDTSLFMNYRDAKYIDGGLSDWQGKKFLAQGHDTFFFTTYKWRDIKSLWYWCWTCPNWADQLYQWGVEDATKHLDEIVEFLSDEVRLHKNLETIFSTQAD